MIQMSLDMAVRLVVCLSLFLSQCLLLMCVAMTKFGLTPLSLNLGFFSENTFFVMVYWAVHYA